jgi:general secretion pathway protein D
MLNISGGSKGVMTWKTALSVAALAIVLAGCAQAPAKPSATHLGVEVPPPPVAGPIPPPVQIAPALPKPEPAPPPETYSVVVSNVAAQDLLFALARDAKLNIDIHPGITGSVTLNAVDQTLPQLLERVSRQVSMRYELNGPNLLILPDAPFLRSYRVDYVSLSRDAKSVTSVSTQVSSGQQGGGSSGSSGNNTTSTFSSSSANNFWPTLVANVNAILGDPGPGSAATALTSGKPPAAGAAPQTAGASGSTSVIANAEAGMLFVRATSRQHESVQAYLDEVLASVSRQVLIEATVVEVRLSNDYQRGIDWSRLRNAGASGFQLEQSSAGFPFSLGQDGISNFIVGYASPSSNFSAAVKMLESFGDVRVLSSPKISVLNNQAAVLKVVDNLVYFTITADTTTNNNIATTTFTTAAQSVPVGFIMSVIPQISRNNAVLVSVRPTISRKLRDVPDPNPSLANPCGVGVPNCATPPINNNIPEIQTREMESLLRVQSGQIAVLGGLMEDRVANNEDSIPGINKIPFFGALFSQERKTSTKTELVIFLRTTVIRDPSVDGDYARFRNLLPTENFLTRPGGTAPAAPAAQ